MVKGGLYKIIKEEEQSFDLVGGSIKFDTIRKRVQQGNLTASHPGVHSPVEAMEEYLIVMVIQRARMNQPLSVAEGINLANSIVSGTNMEMKLSKFKKKHKFYKTSATKESKEKTNRLGRSYWKLFLN